MMHMYSMMYMVVLCLNRVWPIHIPQRQSNPPPHAAGFTTMSKEVLPEQVRSCND